MILYFPNKGRFNVGDNEHSLYAEGIRLWVSIGVSEITYLIKDFGDNIA